MPISVEFLDTLFPNLFNWCLYDFGVSSFYLNNCSMKFKDSVVTEDLNSSKHISNSKLQGLFELFCARKFSLALSCNFVPN